MGKIFSKPSPPPPQPTIIQQAPEPQIEERDPKEIDALRRGRGRGGRRLSLLGEDQVGLKTLLGE